MMKFLFRLVFLCMLAIVNLTVSGQKVDSIMNLYHDNYPQEKIHVHFDKRYYNPGETIWFKGYIMSGVSLSDISKNFYAELINEKGEVIQRTVSPVVNASSASSFTVPANYTGQLLHFRAFTTWMLNFDSSFLFNKNIPVITAAAAATTAAVPNTTSIQFFPEGGDLVADVESVVAFKANDRYGMPVKVNGYIKNNTGKKIADFKASHNGMGIFNLIPLKGETYTAVWKDAANKEINTPLPVALDAGVVLHTMNTPGSVTFVVKRSETGDAYKQIYVIGHMDQQMVYKARINLAQDAISSGRIPVDQLPSGLLQVTLFNASWQPLAERIIMVNNNDFIFDTYVRTLAKNMNKRGKNVLEIEIPDTTLSNLSLSVTDAGISGQEENDDNIFSRLLLTGEIRGYVYNPGYYFSSFADSVARQLDLVLLTHGWRRYNWDNVVKGKMPEIRFLPENYITLKGNLMGVNPATLSSSNQLNLIMQFKDSTSQFVSVPIKPGGKFTTAPMLFFDTARIYYQLNNQKQSSESLILTADNGLWNGPAVVRLPENAREGISSPEGSVVARNREVSEQQVRLNADLNRKVQTLQEVTVKARTKSAVDKLEETYTSGLFKGGDGYTFDLSTDISAASAISVFNYLQGKVAGLTINNAMSSEPSLSWRGGTPDLYLNEMRSDASAVSSISMADIAYIKVFRPPFIGGMGGGGGGAIAIYTKKGAANNNADFKGLNKVVVNGYTPVKQFYSPDYTQSNPLNESADLRTTLLWEPYIFLHKDKKKATISFYNNDISKKLKVVVEGVNELGKLTRVETVIE